MKSFRKDEPKSFSRKTDEDKRSVEMKRIDLRSRFISKTPKVDKVSPENTGNGDEKIVDFKSMYKKTKANLDKTLKRNNEKEREHRREVENLKSKIASCKKKLKESSSKIVVEQQLRESIQQDFKSEQVRNSGVDTHIEELNKQILDLQILNDHLEIKVAKTEILKKELSNETQRCEAHKRTFSRQETKISNLNIIKGIQSNNISLLEKYIQENYKEYDIEHALNDISEILSNKNWKSYSPIHLLSKRVKCYEKEFESKQGKRYSTDLLYGFLRESEEDLVFESLDGESYKISYIPNQSKNKSKDRLRNIIGHPASAFLMEDAVYIQTIYEDTKEMREDIKFVENKTMKYKEGFLTAKRVVEYDYIGDFSVLIVSSSNGKKYANRLQKHGIDASYIDAYEKSPLHVDIEMKKADIVLICTANIPHSVNDTIKETSNKYQYIGSHNEDIVYIRTKFAAQQLSLI